MGKSYVRHGTNVVCTNMTCGTPREIWRVDKDGNVINTASKLPLLNIDDKKISDTFVCKMPIKKWGGLLTFLAGVAVGALIVAAVVATGGVGAVLLSVVAVEGWMVGAAIAVGTLAAGYAGYRGIKGVAHDCDNTLESSWNPFHNNVFIEKQHALLNKSKMICTTGGTINIIVNPEQAKKAALYITAMNVAEIYVQLKSKFIQGAIGGLTGGANPFALALSVGFYIGKLNFGGFDFSETDKSNQKYDPMGNLKNTGMTTGAGTGESVVESSITTSVKANKAGVGEAARIDAQVASKIGEAKMKGWESLAYGTQAADASAEAATWGSQVATRTSNGASATSIASAELVEQMCKESSEELMHKSIQAALEQQDILAEAASTQGGKTAAVKAAKTGAWKDGFKNFGKSLGLGLAGAAVGYAVDEGSNWVENKIEEGTSDISEGINSSDDIDIASNANYMGIIANS
ncbi:PAAR-like protein [Prevotella melaninogenica]|uniref:PAAR-like protein n=1 Tax=Prevotella melaninogenica TaxID=28132 RepID=UPI00352E1B7A